MVLNLARYSAGSDRVAEIRRQVDDLLAYMASVGKRPKVVHLFANDYNAVLRSVNAAQRRHARAAVKAEQQKLRAAGQAKAARELKPNPDLVEDVVWDDLPVAPRTYTKPRRVSLA